LLYGIRKHENLHFQQETPAKDKKKGAPPPNTSKQVKPSR